MSKEELFGKRASRQPRVIQRLENGCIGVIDVKYSEMLENGATVEKVFGVGAFELPEDHEARHISASVLLEEYEPDELSGRLRKKDPKDII